MPRAAPCGLLIMDVRMAGTDGRALVPEARRLSATLSVVEKMLAIASRPLGTAAPLGA